MRGLSEREDALGALSDHEVSKEYPEEKKRPLHSEKKAARV